MPPQGSLREALLMTVWLRRQDIEVTRTKALITGMAVSMAGDNKEAVKAYAEYIEAAFPFAKKNKGADDRKRMEILRQQVSQGPISFSPIGSTGRKNPLGDAASRMSKPDGYRKTLQSNARARRG